MGTGLLWIEHLAFVLLLFAALLPWISERQQRWQRIVLIGLVAGVPLLLHAWLAKLALEFRIGWGALHSPWVYATSLAAANGLGVVWVLRRSRRVGQAATTWPRGPLLIAAALACLLDAMTFWNLQLQARQSLSALRAEAGMIAFSALPPRPSAEENALPVLIAALDAIDMDDELAVDWTAGIKEGLPFDTEDPELLDLLERSEPAVDLLHAAADLPRFQPEPSAEDFSWLIFNRIVPDLLRGVDLLRLDARVRLARGDLAGAARNVETILRLARHQLDTPTLVSSMLAGAIRSWAADLTITVFEAPGWEAAALAELDLTVKPLASESMARALRMEEAFGLSMFGRAGDKPFEWDLFGTLERSWWNDLDERLLGPLYLIFLLDAEVSGYREAHADYRALNTIDDVLAMDVDVDSIRARGLLPSMLMTTFQDSYLGAYYSDARMELLLAARGAAVARVRDGAFPEDLGAFEVEGRIRVERDGEVLVFTHETKVRQDVERPSLRLR